MTADSASYLKEHAEKARTRPAQLVQRIATYILREGLAPGDPIPPEPQLQRILNCSRNSIREAIKVMEAVGMVEVRRGTGTFVAGNPIAPLTPALMFQGLVSLNSGGDAAKDIVMLRRGLEIAFLPIVVARLQEDDDTRAAIVAQLQRTVDAMAAAEKAGEDITRLDHRFHNELFEPLRSTTLKQLNDAILTVYFTLLEAVGERLGDHPVFQQHDDAVPAATAHQGIIDALVEGDQEKAVDRLLGHYASLIESIDTVTSGDRPRAI